jgi:hypothetical protein
MLDPITFNPLNQDVNKLYGQTIKTGHLYHTGYLLVANYQSLLGGGAVKIFNICAHNYADYVFIVKNGLLPDYFLPQTTSFSCWPFIYVP